MIECSRTEGNDFTKATPASHSVSKCKLPEKHRQGKSKQAPGLVGTSVPEEGCCVKTDAKQLPRWYVPVGEDIPEQRGGCMNHCTRSYAGRRVTAGQIASDIPDKERFLDLRVWGWVVGSKNSLT